MSNTPNKSDHLDRYDAAGLEFEKAHDIAQSFFDMMWSKGDSPGEIPVCYSTIGRAGADAALRMKQSFEQMRKLCDELEKEVQS